MRLFSAAADPGAAESALHKAITEGTETAVHARAMLSLWERAPHAFALVKRILAGADHGAEAGSTDPVGHWARVFDEVAAVSPSASAALYALGDARLLEDATAELVTWMETRDLLTPRVCALDLGCGSGRVLRAIAERVGVAVGIDVSVAMLRHARTTCASHGNVLLARTSGGDLAPFRDGAFDLVCAVDSFPYLVHAGAELLLGVGRDARRVLKPGGSLLIFNFSYRGDDGRDRQDVESLARACGFAVQTCGERPFSFWDGFAFHLRRRDA